MICFSPAHSGPECNQSRPKILITIRRVIWSGLNAYYRFVDPLNSMEVFSNSYDVIKILFSDWSINIFIVMHRKVHKMMVIETYLGYMNMKTSTDTLRNMYDIIKILFADCLIKIFIVTYRMVHKVMVI